MFAANRHAPADFPVQPHGHDIQHAHRKIPVHTFALGHVTDSMTAAFVGLAKNLYSPRGPRNEIHDRLQKRAFPGSIGANDADQLPWRDIQTHVPNYRFAIPGDRQISDGKWQQTIGRLDDRWDHG